MEFFRKIAAGLVKHDINEFVGESGNIFFSIDTGEFRLSDGVTPGGIVLGSGSGGFTLLPAKSDRLGGVKIGENITVGPDGTISVAAPFSGNYNSLTNKPDLSVYQLKTSAFSGSYNDLRDKPFIPEVPGGLASFVNDVGYVRSTELKPVAFSGSYNDLTNKPAPPVIPTKLSSFVNDTGFITSSAVNWTNLTGKPTWSTVAYSGNYYDLRNLPPPVTVPTKLSEFNNDTGFITSSSLTWNLISNKPAFATVATTGSYNSLINKPFIPTQISQMTDVDTFVRTVLPDQINNQGKFLTTDGLDAHWITLPAINNITDVNQLTDQDGLLDKVDLSAVAQNIIPAATNTYSLGTSSKQWNNLYTSGKIVLNNNITISSVNGGVNIESDSADLTINGAVVITTDTIDEYTTGTGTGGSGISRVIKTFNILNEFSGPLIGTAVFVPSYVDVIRSVQLVNGKHTSGDLMVGLYRNNELLNFFKIPSGDFKAFYSGFEYALNNNDYLTVNVISGTGMNFSLTLMNTA